MKKLLQRLFSRPVVKLVSVDSPDLRLSTWRENENLVAEWSNIVRLPIFKAALQTIKNESPLHYGEEKSTADGKILRLGVIEGYQLALNNLEAMAELAQKQKPLEATFEAPTRNETETEIE